LTKNSRKLFFDVVKYGATLSLAGFLLWYVYRDVPLTEIRGYFDNINYYWLGFSVIIALASHYLRAYRWNLLLEPLGYPQLKTSRTFLAVMVGYFANNLVPRLGEVTRCGVMKKNDDVSMTSAFGSVVAERSLDLVMLAILAGFTFFLEFDKLRMFVYEKLEGSIPNIESYYPWIFAMASIALIGIFLLYFLFRAYRAKLRTNSLYLKARQLAKKLLEGFLSIRKLNSPLLFWLSTLGIWVLYYSMLIAVFYAFPPTAGLTYSAGLTLLIMSGLGMSAPVQGGIGVFHILVSSVLVLYGVSASDGKVFALIAHSTQFMTIMVFGGLSFIVSIFVQKQKVDVNQ
jgi:uncharacterized protein (TIRG00374 family)